MAEGAKGAGEDKVEHPGTTPETVLKRRRRAEAWAERKAAQRQREAERASRRQESAFKRAEQYVKEYRQQVLPRPFSRLSQRLHEAQQQLTRARTCLSPL